MGLPSGPGIPRLQFNTIFQWVNNWTQMRGNHQLRWGVDARRQRFDFLTVNESSRGNFGFAQNITGDGGVSGTGLGMGTFLLGLPTEFDRAVFSQFPAERDTRFAWYFQDDWHVTPKLTLNLGLRYEYIGPFTEANHRLVNLDIAPGFAAVAPVQAGQTLELFQVGGVVFAVHPRAILPSALEHRRTRRLRPELLLLQLRWGRFWYALLQLPGPDSAGYFSVCQLLPH